MNIKFFLFIILSLTSFDVFPKKWSLDSCISYALNNNIDLLSNLQFQKAVSIDKSASLGDLFPEIDFVSGLDYYWQIPIQTFPGELLGQQSGTFVAVRTGTPWMGNYGIQSSMNLINVEVWQNIKLKTLQKQAQKSEFLSFQDLLIRNVKISYYIVQLQKRNLENIQKRYGIYLEIHQLIIQQFEKGLIDKISYNQSLAILKEREVLCTKSESELLNSQIDLKFWMGYPLDKEILISTENDIYNLELLPFEIELSPDFKYKKSKIDIAKQEYKLSISSLYPKLTLKSAYWQSGFGEKSNFISQSEWFSSGYIGVNLTIPITSVTNIFELKKKKALIKYNELKFKHYLDNQHKKYLNEVILLNESLKILQIQKENFSLAEENEYLSIKKIGNGIIDMIQLKQIQQDLNIAQEFLNNSEINYIKHYVEITYLQRK